MKDELIKKLAESGLTEEDAVRLGMEYVPNAAKINEQFKPYCGIRINYYDTNDALLPDKKGNPPYYRIRYLGNHDTTPFGKVSKGSIQRYSQPSNTLPCAYFPRIVRCQMKVSIDNYESVDTSWREQIDSMAPLIITEGEFKAAKASKEGFPTIGLGGIYSWRALKKGVHFIESLAEIPWRSRHVYICFDSDYRTNKQVCEGLRMLAAILEEYGAEVNLVTLPQIQEGKKTGLDDFFVQNSVLASSIFRQLLKHSEPLGIAKTLFSLNESYVVVEKPLCVFNKKTGEKIPPVQFQNFIESDAKYAERILRPNGRVDYKYVKASKKWIEWPLRDRVNRLDYLPGRPVRCEKLLRNHPHTCYNVWPGWGCEPKEGYPAPFVRLIDHLFSQDTQEAKEWFLDWLAYPIQFPGTKMYTACVFHSIKHGVGKSLVGYTMGKIYGENFSEITQRDLTRDGTTWADNKQFIMGDDVTGSDQRNYAGMLRALITQEKIIINEKYVPSYPIDSTINFFFTSNNPDAFFMDDTDRRFFIVEVPTVALELNFYLKIYDPWLRSRDGPATLRWWLEQRDLSKFSPKAPALRTPAKERMIEDCRSDLARWVREFLEFPHKYIDDYPYDLITASKLLEFYDPRQRTKTTINGLNREMRRSGAVFVLDGKRINFGGTSERYYVIRNNNKWKGATTERVKRHLVESTKTNLKY